MRAQLNFQVGQVGFRDLLELTPLDATLVRGSHGRVTTAVADSPVFASHHAAALDDSASLHATDVQRLLLRHLGAEATEPARNTVTSTVA